jgi:hypothetical protein
VGAHDSDVIMQSVIMPGVIIPNDIMLSYTASHSGECNYTACH